MRSAITSRNADGRGAVRSSRIAPRPRSFREPWGYALAAASFSSLALSGLTSSLSIVLALVNVSSTFGFP